MTHPLPVGTVTLLLADIEGSTVLWETQPAEMTTAIARYDVLLAETIERHDGVRPQEQGEGDSFVAAFTRPTDAVECALALQADLSRDAWPFRVRMALHTGEVQQRDEHNYIGTTINRCARLRAIAHGGQTVLSQPVHDLVVDQSPAGVSFDDMGVHRLRDLSSPEHVYQLRHPDVTPNSAPLRSLDVVPNNLPVELTSFVGRQREIDNVAELLQTNRMVTLLGTGGCGKTRLSLQVAAQALDDFPDGVWLVELAPIDDPGLVPQTVAAAMNIREQPGRAVVETLEASITKNATLLVLDNCEHLVGAAAELASALLSRCPGLTVLATTREALGVPGELTFTIPSLVSSEAVELFVERATRARHDFALVDDNRPAIEQICAQLDGIPLALELAAARTRMLSPQQICEGLADRFRLLTTGARTLTPRQQTLRASVDWSFDLLTEVEQVALRRLSVFAGGFDLNAAEDVVGGAPVSAADVLDLVGSLVDKSLVLTDVQAGVVRYRMLDTIRHYGAERLDESGERAEVVTRHRSHYRALLAQAATEEEGPNQAAWSARVRGELDNIRAALQSALLDDDPEALIELTCGTGNTWTITGGSSEHRRWLDAAIARAPKNSPWHASALYQQGITDMFVGNMIASEAALGAAAQLYRAAGDEAGALWAHAEWAWTVAFVNGLVPARPLYEDGIERAISVGADGPRFSMEFGLAQLLMFFGHLDEARTRCEALVARPATVEHFGWWAKACHGITTALLGELDEAVARLDDVIAYGRAVGDVIVLVPTTWALGCAHLRRGDLAAARAFLDEAAMLHRDHGTAGLPVALHGRGLLLLAEDDLAAARAAIDQGVEEAHAVSPAIAMMHAVLRADVLLATGDVAGAAASVAGTLIAARDWDTPADLGAALVVAARIARRQDEPERAESSAHEALAIFRPMGHKLGVVDAFEVAGGIAADAESYEEAARILAAADALRRAIGYLFRAPAQQREYDATMATVRSALDATAFEAAWEQGAGLGWEEACDYVGRGRGERKRPSTGWAALTPTEAKVVALVAEGLTNPQVGARLFISKHTVDSHLRHIFAKLGLSSRAELAAAAARRDGADA